MAGIHRIRTLLVVVNAEWKATEKFWGWTVSKTVLNWVF